MASSALMSNPKKKKPDRHKPRKMVGIRGHFVDPAEGLASRLGKGFGELVNDALREFLERHGAWPRAKEGGAE